MPLWLQFPEVPAFRWVVSVRSILLLLMRMCAVHEPHLISTTLRMDTPPSLSLLQRSAEGGKELLLSQRVGWAGTCAIRLKTAHEMDRLHQSWLFGWISASLNQRADHFCLLLWLSQITPSPSFGPSHEHHSPQQFFCLCGSGFSSLSRILIPATYVSREEGDRSHQHLPIKRNVLLQMRYGKQTLVQFFFSSFFSFEFVSFCIRFFDRNGSPC